MEFKKEFKFKILSLLFAGIFFVTTSAYGVDLSEKTHLRKPLSFNTSVNGDGLKRSEGVKNEVASELSKSIKKGKILAKLKRKTKLAIALGLSVVIAGGIVYLYNGTNHSLHDRSKAELTVDSLLSKQYFIEDRDSVVFLDRALFDALEELGYDAPGEFSEFKDLLAYDYIASAFLDSSFPSFLKNIIGNLSLGGDWSNVAEVAKIWNFFKNIRNDKEYSEIYRVLDFANIELIQTVRFQDAARFLSSNLDYYDQLSLSEIFWTALEISKDFESKKEEWKEIMDFLKAEGNSIEARDYYFLNIIVRSPSMMTRLKDRKWLESRISEIYANNPPARRGDMEEYYDERQDPSTLPSIVLLYTITLYDSFNSEEFQRDIAEVFQKDLDPDDGAQEHGGFFKFDVKREIFLPIEVERLEILPRDENSWGVDEVIFPDHYLRPSFHLHAISSDNRKQAGPTLYDIGRSLMKLPDIGVVVISGQHNKSYFGAVFTSLGFEGSGHLLVNLDAYSLANGEYFVVDIGIKNIKISVSSPKKSVVPDDFKLERPEEASSDSSMSLDLNEDAYRAISSGL